MAPIRPGRVCGIPVSGARTQDWSCRPQTCLAFRQSREAVRPTSMTIDEGDPQPLVALGAVIRPGTFAGLARERRLVRHGAPARLGDGEGLVLGDHLAQIEA